MPDVCPLLALRILYDDFLAERERAQVSGVRIHLLLRLVSIFGPLGLEILSFRI